MTVKQVQPSNLQFGHCLFSSLDMNPLAMFEFYSGGAGFRVPKLSQYHYIYIYELYHEKTCYKHLGKNKDEEQLYFSLPR